MRKLINYILAALFAVSVVSSCTILEGPLFGGEVLTLDGEDSYVMPSEGGNAVLTLKSRKEWSASSSQSWCKVSPASGDKGTCIFTINADKSEDTQERMATVTITAGDETKTIKVTQKQKDALIVTSNRVEVASAGKTISIDVKHNVDFTCEVESSAKGWIVPKSTKALKVSTMVFDVVANDDLEKRQGVIYIKSGDMKEAVTVYQEGTDPIIVLSQNEYVVDSDGEEITIQLKSNTQYEMIIPKEALWVEEIKTKAMTDYIHYIEVKPNETYDSREVFITFVDKSGAIEDSVKITQVQKDAIILAQSEYVLESTDTELSIDVLTNVDLEVSTSVDWMRYTPQTKGLENVGLSFELDINTEPQDREGVITISNGELTQEIKVTQLTGAEKSLVRIEHTNKTFTVPFFTSSTHFAGMVFWGDGNYDDYVEGLKHDYVSQKTYVANFEMWGVEEITLNDIIGVTSVDLTEF